MLSNKGSDNETMFRKEKILGGQEFAVTNTRLHPGPEKLQGKVISSQIAERSRVSKGQVCGQGPISQVRRQRNHFWSQLKMEDNTLRGQEFLVPGGLSILADSRGHGNSSHSSGLF